MANIIFQDLSDKSLAFKINGEAIKNSIRNFFYTIKGSLPTDPYYGSSINEFIFSPMDKVMEKIFLQNMIIELYNYEKRITVIDAEMQSTPEYGRVNIIIIYTINGSEIDSNPESLKLTFNQ